MIALCREGVSRARAKFDRHNQTGPLPLAAPPYFVRGRPLLPAQADAGGLDAAADFSRSCRGEPHRARGAGRRRGGVRRISLRKSIASTPGAKGDYQNGSIEDKRVAALLTKSLRAALKAMDARSKSERAHSRFRSGHRFAGPDG